MLDIIRRGIKWWLMPEPPLDIGRKNHPTTYDRYKEERGLHNG